MSFEHLAEWAVVVVYEESGVQFAEKFCNALEAAGHLVIRDSDAAKCGEGLVGQGSYIVLICTHDALSAPWFDVVQRQVRDDRGLLLFLEPGVEERLRGRGLALVDANDWFSPGA